MSDSESDFEPVKKEPKKKAAAPKEKKEKAPPKPKKEKAPKAASPKKKKKHISSGSEVPYCEDTDEGQNCGNAVTPTGVYQYQRRIEGWRKAPLGKLYNPVYFNGGIAVHGANSVPNHPASHGCVRISMSIAEYFPGLVNNGDTIEVFRS